MDRATPEPAEEPRPEFVVVFFARLVVVVFFGDVYGYHDDESYYRKTYYYVSYYTVATDAPDLPATTRPATTTATVDDSKFFKPVLSLVLYSAGSAAADAGARPERWEHACDD